MKTLSAINQLLHQILDYCLLINECTQYAAFCDISGHVSQVAVRIGLDKETQYTDRLFESSVYYGDTGGSDVSFIPRVKEFVEKMEAFMSERGIDYQYPVADEESKNYHSHEGFISPTK